MHLSIMHYHISSLISDYHFLSLHKSLVVYPHLPSVYILYDECSEDVTGGEYTYAAGEGGGYLLKYSCFRSSSAIIDFATQNLPGGQGGL